MEAAWAAAQGGGVEEEGGGAGAAAAAAVKAADEKVEALKAVAEDARFEAMRRMNEAYYKAASKQQVVRFNADESSKHAVKESSAEPSQNQDVMADRQTEQVSTESEVTKEQSTTQISQSTNKAEDNGDKLQSHSSCSSAGSVMKFVVPILVALLAIVGYLVLNQGTAAVTGPAAATVAIPPTPPAEAEAAVELGGGDEELAPESSLY